MTTTVVSKWFKVLYETTTTANGIQINHGTTAERTAAGALLTAADKGLYFWLDDDEGRTYMWFGTEWV